MLYRVWTGKRYLTPAELDEAEITVSHTGALIVNNAKKIPKDVAIDIDLLQKITVELSTGLYDGKGNEIFEGDILEFCGLHLLVVREPDKAGFDFRCARFYNNGKDVFVFDRSSVASMFKKGDIHHNIDLLSKTYNGE